MKRIRVVKLSPEVVSARLAEYEARFGMSSTEFLRRFESGELDHGQSTREFTNWASLAMSRSTSAKLNV